MRVTYVPPTKIEPTVRSSFSLSDSRLVTYKYTIFNGKNAKHNVETVGVNGITRIASNQPVEPLTPGMDTDEAVAAARSLMAPIIRPEQWV